MNLKKERLRNNLTQLDVSKALEISKNTYINWETGANKISEENLNKLKKLFDFFVGCSGCDFLEITNWPLTHDCTEKCLHDPIPENFAIINDFDADCEYYKEWIKQGAK